MTPAMPRHHSMMGRFLCAAAVFCCVSQSAYSQWQTTSYTLKGGWNAIHLSGDADWDTLENLFPAEVQEVWRWNPNPTQIQFIDSPLQPSAGTPDWTVWRRGDSAGSTLSTLSGQTSYLVKCSGLSTASYTCSIRQALRPPSNIWVRSGANLLGFPTAGQGNTSPLFSTYFATFPAVIATNTRIFKYIGGDLGSSNPMQIFSPSAERMDRTKAYWFSSEVVGNFHAPVEFSTESGSGIAFGRNGEVVKAYFRNRAASPVTLSFTPLASEAAPAGKPTVLAAVPLTRQTFNGSTGVWDSTPVSAAFNITIPANTQSEVRFGINRASSAMLGAADGGFFASLLRVQDSAGLFDVFLPASATKTSLQGLWLGDITLNQVGFDGAAAGGTPQAMPLRTLLHIPESGPARLLSKVFIGRLAASPNDVGVCTDETLLKQDERSTAQRLVSAHMPLNRVISASGNAAPGSTATFTVEIPFNDPTSPFVHQYHPDHDNKNPRGQALGNGVESYSVTRTCRFTFTTTPPTGSTSISGWGSSVIGGTYSETIHGLHRNDLTVNGTFELRRASDSGTLH